MQYDKCKVCGYEDDVEYLNVIYAGHLSWNKIAYCCEKCIDRIFSDPERSKREDSNLEKYIDSVSFGWIAKQLEMRCSEHGGNIVREVQ